MEELIEKLKVRLRITILDEEVEDLVKACQKDLEISGIYGEFDDPLYYQAIVLYLKAYFGYNDKQEEFQRAYEALKTSMALSGDYEKVESGQE